VTNNSSEQALRWSVVFRKVTKISLRLGGGVIRSGASLVNTAQRQGISAFDAISHALTSQQTDWLLS
jgi:transposase